MLVFFSSRRRHTRCLSDWSSDVCSSDLIYVSPAEVEAALITHEAVLEAAVVGAEDENKLVKPKAYVVLKQLNSGTDALKEIGRASCRERVEIAVDAGTRTERHHENEEKR